MDGDIFLRAFEKSTERSIPRELEPGFERPANESAEPIALGRRTIGIGSTRMGGGGGGRGGQPTWRARSQRDRAG